MAAASAEAAAECAVAAAACAASRVEGWTPAIADSESA